MNIAIIGTGVYGIAMAQNLAQNKNNKITMWTESHESFERLEATRNNFELLDGLKIDESITFTESYETALKNAKIVFIMAAAKFVSSVCQNMLPYITNDMHFVIGSKGIEQNTCRFIHEIFKDNISDENLAVISGPTFAIDIANLEPVGLTIASKNIETINVVCHAYDNTTATLVASSDLLGAELCGSIKNVIAIASGMLEGLGYKESTRCLLITKAADSIKKLIKELDGNELTIMELAGIGDLVLTTTSPKSRNFSYGILLGQKRNEEALEFTKTNTVEGYYTLESIYELLNKKNLKCPLIETIYNIVSNNCDSEEIIKLLLNK